MTDLLAAALEKAQKIRETCFISNRGDYYWQSLDKAIARALLTAQKEALEWAREVKLTVRSGKRPSFPPWPPDAIEERIAEIEQCLK